MKDLIDHSDIVDRMGLRADRRTKLIEWLSGTQPWTDEEQTEVRTVFDPMAKMRLVKTMRKQQLLKAVNDPELRLRLVRFSSGDPNATLDP